MAPSTLLALSSLTSGNLPRSLVITHCCPACRKLQDKGGQISDVRNIAQLLVVIHLPDDHNAMLFGSAVQYCYHVMGLVHAKWAPIPGAIKVRCHTQGSHSLILTPPVLGPVS